MQPMNNDDDDDNWAICAVHGAFMPRLGLPIATLARQLPRQHHALPRHSHALYACIHMRMCARTLAHTHVCARMRAYEGQKRRPPRMVCVLEAWCLRAHILAHARTRQCPHTHTCTCPCTHTNMHMHYTCTACKHEAAKHAWLPPPLACSAVAAAAAAAAARCPPRSEKR